MAGRRKREELTEIEVMLVSICCDLGEVPVSYIHREINKKMKRSYTAVKTELGRIAAKGYLNQRKLGPIWLYSPIKSKQEVLGEAIDRFIGNVLNNSLSPLFSHFAHSGRKISPEEMRKLKELIDQAKED